MKIAFLGDSITVGYALPDRTKRFSTLLSERRGVEEYNLGITGTLVAKAGLNRADTRSYVDRLPQIAGADVAVIFGGTNDYFWSDATIDPPNGEQDSDVYFRHALRTICRMCKTDFPEMKILLVTPYPHHGHGNFLGGEGFKDANDHDTDAVNYNGHTLKDYADVVASVAAEEGIAVLKLFEKEGFDWRVHTIDGCHPNEAGHAWLADRVDEALSELIG